MGIVEWWNGFFSHPFCLLVCLLTTVVRLIFRHSNYSAHQNEISIILSNCTYFGLTRLVEGNKFLSNREYPHSLVDVVAPNSCLEDHSWCSGSTAVCSNYWAVKFRVKYFSSNKRII